MAVVHVTVAVDTVVPAVAAAVLESGQNSG